MGIGRSGRLVRTAMGRTSPGAVVFPSLVGVAWILLAVTARAVEGQGTVRSAHMVVDLSGAGSEARVRLEYLLDGVPEGRVLGLSVLRFGAARVADVRAGEEAVALHALPGVAEAATVTAVAADVPGSARVALSYMVASPVTTDGDQALRGYLPVVSLDLPPEEARPGLFQAELILPGSWRLSDAFPTGLAPAAADGEAGRWAVDLPVVPSVVSFRAHLDARWHAGLPLILDLLAGAILLLFASLGWKHLRRFAR